MAPPNLQWIREKSATWDANKARVLGSAPDGVFAFTRKMRPGALVPGEWWRVESNGEVLGYGWMDINWSQGELLLAVDAHLRDQGIGTFIIEHLHGEARVRGLNYVYNAIPPAHPDPERLAAWLAKRGYQERADGEMRANLASNRDLSKVR